MKTIWIVALAGALALAACDRGESAPADEPAPAEAPAAQQPAEEAAAEPAEEAEEAGEPAAKQAEQAELAADMAPGQTERYGGEFALDGEPITLAAALEKGDKGPYKISGTIEKVCKAKGCWFALTGEGVEEPVRVRMKDYGFFVPRNSEQATAVVEGEVITRVVAEAERQHYAEDEAAATGEPAKTVEGDAEQNELIITAAQLTLPKS